RRLEAAADDLPLVRPVLRRRGEEEHPFIGIDDDRLHRHGRAGKAARTLGGGQERLGRGHCGPPYADALCAHTPIMSGVHVRQREAHGTSEPWGTSFGRNVATALSYQLFEQHLRLL